MSAITLSESKGQITLPSDIRKHLGLHTGDRMIAEELNGTVVLRPLKFKGFVEACESEPKICHGKAVPAEEMDDAAAGSGGRGI